ncbi:nicotinate-nucleotide adenylyltransferase [Vibrio phage vB_ValM_R10Z]|nr:nicotinate-nucleotide adenylyltransferase [Vibrio phage vB_ValM_R10Z]
MNPYDLVRKMQKVVESCTTIEQLRNARKYLMRCQDYALDGGNDAYITTIMVEVQDLDERITNKIVELSDTRGMNAIETGVIKVGIDIHGVIDQSPEFFALLSKLPVEVHIITGIKEELDTDVPDDLEYDHWFSIHQSCEDDGVEILYDEKGRPWVDDEIWNNKKAEYCRENQINIMIDDSPTYARSFEGLDTFYLQLTNTVRDEWRRK